jgi:predicted Zn-dependent protease
VLKKKVFLAVFSVFLLSFVITSSVSAYTLLGGKYASKKITYIGSALDATYTQAMQNGINAWNNASVDASFTRGELGPDTNVVFEKDNYGANIGWNARCANKPVHTSGTYTRSEIDFNTSTMDGMTNNQRQGVSAHELGHALGLDHVISKTQIMCTWGNGRTAIIPGSDDKAGVNYLY